MSDPNIRILVQITSSVIETMVEAIELHYMPRYKLSPCIQKVLRKAYVQAFSVIFFKVKTKSARAFSKSLYCDWTLVNCSLLRFTDLPVCRERASLSRAIA